MGTDAGALKFASWLGWALVIFAWCDLGLSWLFGVHIWTLVFDGMGPDRLGASVPVIVGCIGVVLVGIGRRETKTLPPPGGGSAKDR
jgi:hypothetical protein